MGYDGLDVTDFTLEALRGAMADNDGSCLVHMHEGKKLCSLGQYKKGGDDSVEVLMEALDGVPMRIARKGGGGQEPAEEDGAEEEVAVEPSRRKQKTVTITTIQPHLNMSVLTHPQHQYRQSAAEEADPVGNVTRQSTGMMRAITYDAPDAKDVLSWMAKINEWPKLHIILAMVNIFCALVFARRAERKAKHAFLYLDADAYAVLQAFFLKIKAKMDAISGACMS